jgi:hypothetical protein
MGAPAHHGMIVDNQHPKDLLFFRHSHPQLPV